MKTLRMLGMALTAVLAGVNGGADSAHISAKEDETERRDSPPFSFCDNLLHIDFLLYLLLLICIFVTLENIFHL